MLQPKFVRLVVYLPMPISMGYIVGTVTFFRNFIKTTYSKHKNCQIF